MFRVHTQNICHGARGRLQVMGLEKLGSLTTGNVGGFHVMYTCKQLLLTEAMQTLILCACMCGCLLKTLCLHQHQHQQ